MHLMDIVVAILASQQVVETWHKSSIFATQRAKINIWPDDGFWGFLRSLLECRFCLSHWTSGGVVLLLTLSANKWLTEWAWIVELPIQALAVTGGAQLVHDLCRRKQTTPQSEGSRWSIASPQSVYPTTQAEDRP